MLLLALVSVAAGKLKFKATSFSYAPASAVVWWVDANGNHGGAPGDDLAYFDANADFDSVTVLDLDPADLGTDTPITSVSNLADLPNLAVLDVANNPDLSALNLSGCELLERVLASNCSLNVKQVNTVLHDLVRASLGQHAARVDDVGAVDEPQRLAHVVVGDQHADAAALE